jgi:hypothetical protein
MTTAAKTQRARPSPALVLWMHPRMDEYDSHMSPTWIWMQIAIVVFVVIGMIVAITKLV